MPLPIQPVLSLSKRRAPRNRTLTLSANERKLFAKQLLVISSPVNVQEVINRTIYGDMFDVLEFLPDRFVDLLFIDPPYNLTKSFNGQTFKSLTADKYEQMLEAWVQPLIRVLTASASIYVCGDWRSSAALFNVCSKYFKIQNRIIWEREKGRSAKSNWKNCAEDIWFCTMSDKYTFDVDRVKMHRRVIAPYRDKSGRPKDWEEHKNGNHRLTSPSNLWTDITVPFWSMRENTDHPTQKPEKLLAKIILASTNKGDVVFDPFLGSGTTSVVAKKLGRRYVGIERDSEYCCLAEKRLILAEKDDSIQGYEGNIFRERNYRKNLSTS